VAVAAVAAAGGMAVFLDQFAAALDTTVTVDNPAYSGDSFSADSAVDRTPSGCEKPETVERYLGAMVADALSWLPPASLVLVAVWAGAIRTHGLAETHDAPISTAAAVVAALTLVGSVFELG